MEIATNMLEDLIKCKDRVEYLLRLSEILLASDTPTSESIRRVRQKFQESGLYVGTKRAQKMEEAENVRLWARKRSFTRMG